MQMQPCGRKRTVPTQIRESWKKHPSIYPPVLHYFNESCFVKPLFPNDITSWVLVIREKTSTLLYVITLPLCTWEHPSHTERSDTVGCWWFGPAGCCWLQPLRLGEKLSTGMMALHMKNREASYYQSAPFCRHFSFTDTGHYLARFPGKEGFCFL